MAVSNSILELPTLRDENGKVVYAPQILGTTVRTFNAASQRVQMPTDPNGTARDGWIVSFTTDEDCWVAIGDVTVTAAVDTTNSFPLLSGAVLGPIDMGNNTYVAAIQESAAGCLTVLRHNYRSA